MEVLGFHICSNNKERAEVINIAETPNRAGEQAGGEAGRHKQIWVAQLVQWTPLNGITLGQVITDYISQVITITVHTLYTEYAIERLLGLDNDPYNHDPIKRRPLYFIIE